MAKSLSPLAKTINSLSVHSWFPPSSKFMGKILLFKSSFFNLIYSESHRFHAIRYKNSSTLASILPDS